MTIQHERPAMTDGDRLKRGGTWRAEPRSTEGTQWVFEPERVSCLAAGSGSLCPCAQLGVRAQVAVDCNDRALLGLPDQEFAVAAGELSVSRRGLTLLAAAAYGVPLVALLVGAAIGQALGGDAFAAALGLTFATPSFVLFRWRGAALLAQLDVAWRAPRALSGQRLDPWSAQSDREFPTR